MYNMIVRSLFLHNYVYVCTICICSICLCCVPGVVRRRASRVVLAVARGLTGTTYYKTCIFTQKVHSIYPSHGKAAAAVQERNWQMGRELDGDGTKESTCVLCLYSG